MNRFKGTPGPWKVRTLERNGEIVDCFVSANDVNGNPFDAEILGDDEYDCIERKLADAQLISVSLRLLNALINLVEHLVIEDEEGLIEFNEDICEAKAAISEALGE